MKDTGLLKKHLGGSFLTKTTALPYLVINRLYFKGKNHV